MLSHPFLAGSACAQEDIAPLQISHALQRDAPAHARIADAVMRRPVAATVSAAVVCRALSTIGQPVHVYLRQPALASRFGSLGSRFASGVRCRSPEGYRRSLVTARHWTAQYEWYCASPPSPLKAGLSAAVANLAQGGVPRRMQEDEAVI